MAGKFFADVIFHKLIVKKNDDNSNSPRVFANDNKLLQILKLYFLKLFIQELVRSLTIVYKMVYEMPQVQL